jgi:hypothetical protein
MTVNKLYEALKPKLLKGNLTEFQRDIQGWEANLIKATMKVILDNYNLKEKNIKH